MFSQFPKQRTPLPPEYAAIYLQHYRNSREGKSQILSLAQRAERWMHRKVAKDVAAGSPKATLEIGAGNLNQLPYEPYSQPYDIVEPFRELYESSPHRQRVRNIYDDVSQIPHEHRYDRITSIAVLEHVCNLPELVARSALLLTDGGSFRAGIPSEGTILWRLGWQLTTALDFRARHNLDYQVLMRYEHQRFRSDALTLLLPVLCLREAGPGALPELPGYFFLNTSTAFQAASGGCSSYSSARSRYILARASSG